MKVRVFLLNCQPRELLVDSKKDDRTTDKSQIKKKSSKDWSASLPLLSLLKL